MPWCFAIVNNKLAEIYFDESKKKSKGLPNIWGHCYVDNEKFTTKQEKKWIKEDTAKYQFSYKNGYYKDKKTLVKIKNRASDFLTKGVLKKEMKT